MLLSDDLLYEIHKFPFPIQKLLGEEALAVYHWLEQGKALPNLTTIKCHCHFFVRYLLPCCHIFHEHLFGQKLLTDISWHSFQLMFEESGFEIYEHREYVDVPEDEPTQAERDAEHLRVQIGEINERLRNTYFRILEYKGVEGAAQFVGQVEAMVVPLLNL